MGCLPGRTAQVGSAALGRGSSGNPARPPTPSLAPYDVASSPKAHWNKSGPVPNWSPRQWAGCSPWEQETGFMRWCPISQLQPAELRSSWPHRSSTHSFRGAAGLWALPPGQGWAVRPSYFFLFSLFKQILSECSRYLHTQHFMAIIC